MSGMNWIPMKSRYAGQCQVCGLAIHIQDPIYWNSETSEIRHEKCLDSEYYKTFNQNKYRKGGH